MVSSPRAPWAVSGVLAGLAGLATSYATAMLLTIRGSPVVAVSELVIDLTPGPVAERAIAFLGHWDKPLLLAAVLLILGGLFAYAGLLARRSWWRSSLVFVALAVIGLVAVVLRPSTDVVDGLPIAVGLATWLVALSLLVRPLSRQTGTSAAESGTGYDRRIFLIRAGIMGLTAVGFGVLGNAIGRGRSQVERTRRLLKLPVRQGPVPAEARIGLAGISPWRTPTDRFYRIDTALVVPTVDPADWRLRIHGMVDREVTLTYQSLINREIAESWITLNCVSNPVGGDLVGNAWWSGVRMADLLAEAGVSADADAVLQTSEDGWTCGTPLSTLTDSRDAMLAIGMNGLPLPIDHGFPVRTIVPGLYGYVSACKWVVDLEVTRFDRIEAYWTGKGWSEQGPVKIASRVEVPTSGAQVPPGEVRIGGTAWMQHTGIEAVEVALDGGAWQRAEVANPGTDDTWVQWATTVEVEPGEHEVRVRATDRLGNVQTGVERDVLPDGATGWHTVSFTADE